MCANRIDTKNRLSHIFIFGFKHFTVNVFKTLVNTFL